ncbi:MAG: glucokinase [Alphaproteobacteria bacterium]
MQNRSTIWLFADIGATYVRFAIYDPTQETYSDPSQTLVAQYDSLAAACKSYLEERALTISAAAIAIACPILGDQVTMTNHSWGFSQQQFKHDLQLDHLIVINDQVAIARGIPFLPQNAIQPLGGVLAIDESAPKGVLAPGSGLGTATLVPTANGWHAFASEGGHVTLAATNEFEAQVIAALAKKHGGHISAERLVSGQGIVNLYQTICQLEGCAPSAPLTAQDIVAAGATDDRAQKTIAGFTGFLGNVAGNLALSLGARGGIYVSGGIISKLGQAFDVKVFRDAFEAKGRFADYLHATPTFLITHPMPAFIGIRQMINSLSKS